MTPTLLSYWLNGNLARYLRKRAEINEKQGFQPDSPLNYSICLAYEYTLAHSGYDDANLGGAIPSRSRFTSPSVLIKPKRKFFQGLFLCIYCFCCFCLFLCWF